MTEQLFQYLWKNSLFRPEGLSTTDGEELVVLSTGRLNKDAGPDFTEGRIRVGHTEWMGNIELHLKSSDWVKHGHDKDPKYKNVILHVVLENDLPKCVGNFPTLELSGRFPQDALNRYQRLMENEQRISCSRQIHLFPDIKWKFWLNRLLIERMEDRLTEWSEVLEECDRDWRQLLYLRLAANFGFHKNKEAFLQLARSLPLNVLAKHSDQVFQLEALLFGQSGLLAASGGKDDYSIRLQKEYNFLRRKYKLEPEGGYNWKFLRMRPSNFPTIRIAQFARLIHQNSNLFSKMMQVRDQKSMIPYFDIVADGYWENHYRFGEESKAKKPKKLGKSAIQNILINTVAPMQFLYAKLQGKESLIETSLDLLETLPPEDNNIIKEWVEIGKAPQNAAESQALIQLFNQYCSPRKCLDCAVGSFLVKDSGIDYTTL